jgi:anthranilate phosphoribosyltransferase
LSPEQLKTPKLEQNDLYGGESIADSLVIFNKILNLEGTKAQNEVVYANAGAAIWVANDHLSLEDCMVQAKESLLSKKAKNTFETFLSLNS